jgi:hypothetical protein
MRERCIELAEELRQISCDEESRGRRERAWFYRHVAEVLSCLVDWGLV